MASRLDKKTSSFGKKIVIFILAASFLVVLPLYISTIEVKNSKKAFTPISLVKNLRIPEGESVAKRFAAYGYNLTEVKNGTADVPNLFLEKLPSELTTIQDPDYKKDLFISALLPPILKVNEYIRFERIKLEEIIQKIELNGKASNDDLFWLRRKMIRYRMDEFDIEELYNRMNIIPPSLALTQAVIETGWGTSRFAQEANALYGQWTWDDSDGVIPLERQAGEKHSIKKFTNLISAVESYALNLNTHEAYEDFRLERAKFGDPDKIEVEPLLITLMFYSELGYEYIDNLDNIIRVNKLDQFNSAKLQSTSYQGVRSIPAP